MKVLEGAPVYAEPRKMTVDRMQIDFQYEMANMFAGQMLENGMITAGEFERLMQLNIESFDSVYKEILA